MKVSLLNCPRCSTHFTSRDALLAHLKEASHFGLSVPRPQSSEGTEQESTPKGPWDSASFLVPHLPDDPLLYSLEDQEGESEEEMEHGNEAQDEVGSLVSQSSGLPRTVSMDPGYEADVSMHGGKHAPGTSHVTRETRVPADPSSSSAGSEWGQRTSPGRGPSTRTLESESGGASKQRVSFGEEPARSPGRVATNRGPPKAGGLKARVSVPAPLDSGLTRGLHEGDRLGLLERENEDLRAELAAMKIAQQETEDLQVSGSRCIGTCLQMVRLVRLQSSVGSCDLGSLRLELLKAAKSLKLTVNSCLSFHGAGPRDDAQDYRASPPIPTGSKCSMSVETFFCCSGKATLSGLCLPDLTPKKTARQPSESSPCELFRSVLPLGSAGRDRGPPVLFGKASSGRRGVGRPPGPQKEGQACLLRRPRLLGAQLAPPCPPHDARLLPSARDPPAEGRQHP
jgi:hypothetical protein